MSHATEAGDRNELRDGAAPPLSQATKTPREQVLVSPSPKASQDLGQSKREGMLRDIVETHGLAHDHPKLACTVSTSDWQIIAWI